VPLSYAPQFRAMVIDQIRAGKPVQDVVVELGVSESTVHRWVRQDRIDRGELTGTSTAESAELRAARRRITELEAELATVKRASELFAEGRVVRPKAVYPIVETLAGEGHGTKRVCRLLGVAPSGFFKWRTTPPSDAEIRRVWLGDVIVKIHTQSRGTYGWRRIRAELADALMSGASQEKIDRLAREAAEPPEPPPESTPNN
jgi:transposase-like protein